MKFASLPIGTLYVVRGDKRREVLKKVSDMVFVCADGTPVMATHDLAELEPLNTLDVLAFEMQQAERGR